MGLRLAGVPAAANAQSAITGDRPRHVWRGPARRHGRSGQPGADREGQDRRHRRQGRLPHHRPSTRHLHRHVHACRLQHVHGATAVELPTDFTATINAELKVGALEETITVTGASPVVDVSSTSRVQVLTREVLDAMPTGRNIYGMSQLVTGVDAQRSRTSAVRAAMQQTYMSTRGLTSANNIVQVDGLMINGLDGDGAVQQYINKAMVQEMTLSRRRRRRGRLAGRRPRQHRRQGRRQQFNGSFFGAWTRRLVAVQQPERRDLQRAACAPLTRSTKIYDFNVGHRRTDQARQAVVLRRPGAPRRRRRPIAEHVLRAPRRDRRRLPGRSGVVAASRASTIRASRARWCADLADQPAQQVLDLLRRDRQVPRSRHERRRRSASTASQIWTSPRYNDAALKCTSTISSKLLLDAGYSFNYEEYVITNQDGINQDRGTPAWYARRQPARDATLVTLRQRAGQLGWTLSRSLQHAGVDVVHHRCAQREGRLPVQLGPLHQHPRDQRRPPAGATRTACRAR